MHTRTHSWGVRTSLQNQQSSWVVRAPFDSSGQPTKSGKAQQFAATDSLVRVREKCGGTLCDAGLSVLQTAGCTNVEQLASIDLDVLLTKMQAAGAEPAAMFSAMAWVSAIRVNTTQAVVEVKCEPEPLGKAPDIRRATAYVPADDAPVNSGSADFWTKDGGKLLVYLELASLPEGVKSLRILNRTRHPGPAADKMATNGKMYPLTGRALEGNKGFIDLDGVKADIRPGDCIVIQGVGANGQLTELGGDVTIGIPKVSGFLSGPRGPGLCPSTLYTSGFSRLVTDCAIENSVKSFVPGPSFNPKPREFSAKDVSFAISEPFTDVDLQPVRVLSSHWPKWINGCFGKVAAISLDQLCTLANKEGVPDGIRAAAQKFLDDPKFRNKVAGADGKTDCANGVALADLEAAKTQGRQVRINVGPQPPKATVHITLFGTSPYPSGGRYRLDDWSNDGCYKNLKLDDQGWLTFTEGGNFKAGADLDISVGSQRIQIKVPESSTC